MVLPVENRPVKILFLPTTPTCRSQYFPGVTVLGIDLSEEGSGCGGEVASCWRLCGGGKGGRRLLSPRACATIVQSEPVRHSGSKQQQFAGDLEV
ncbi:hypothetical protein J6590_061719 [Homalodisca vitripennis]|nr:hypothetical protein J6590_061719 [Homalodisca vitripennis]